MFKVICRNILTGPPLMKLVVALHLGSSVYLVGVAWLNSF